MDFVTISMFVVNVVIFASLVIYVATFIKENKWCYSQWECHQQIIMFHIWTSLRAAIVYIVTSCHMGCIALVPFLLEHHKNAAIFISPKLLTIYILYSYLQMKKLLIVDCKFVSSIVSPDVESCSPENKK